MAAYSAYTNLDLDQIIDRAKAYFGKGGMGLSVEHHGPSGKRVCCLTYSDDKGEVSLSVIPKGRKLEVQLETREWDLQVKEFIKRLV